MNKKRMTFDEIHLLWWKEESDEEKRDVRDEASDTKVTDELVLIFSIVTNVSKLMFREILKIKQNMRCHDQQLYL